MKKLLSTALIVIGSIGLAWFVSPILIYGVINVGNLAGIFASIIFLLYGKFFEKVNTSIKRFGESKKGKAAICAALLVLVFFVGLFTTESYLIVSYAANKPTSETTVVVLGCKANGENPSLMLLRRLQAAKEYLTDNPEVKCIVSGGQGNDETMSEAECMYRWLVKNGIDADRIYKEDKSTSTRENLSFSKEIIEQNDLCKDITIITNEFHQYRSGRIAKNLGFKCTAISGNTPVILLPTYFVREFFSITYEWIR